MHDGLRNSIKALFFMDKIQMFVDDLVAGKGIHILPIHAELDLTSTCNMSCVWCQDLDRKYSKARAGNMPLRTVEQAADMVKAISLKGGGEPTLHPEFARICELLHSKNVDLGLTTNGTIGIEHPEYFTWIKLSMDAWDTESLRRLKGFPALDTILKNASDWSAKTRVGMSFLRHTGIRYDRCLELAKQACVTYCVFREVFGAENEAVPDWLKSGRIDDLNVRIEQPYLQTQNLGCWANGLVLHIGPDSGLNICCWVKYQRAPYAYATEERSVLDCWKSQEHAQAALEFLNDTSRCLDCRFKWYQAEIIKALNDGGASPPSNPQIEDVNFV
jgi:MoaA/NifB/PqqE/SkfB family radical SAM enzyme